jgi:lipoprotein-anchoring transpeptidase ErfK/SrfK
MEQKQTAHRPGDMSQSLFSPAEQLRMRTYPRVRPAPSSVIRVPLPRRRGISPISLFLLLCFFGAMALACLALGGALSYYGYYQYSGRILPGVWVGDVPVGGMAVDEAIIALQRDWELQARIQVTNGIQSQTLTPAELGLKVDIPKTVQEAHEVGHGGTMLAETAQMFAALWDGWQIAPVLTLDETVARERLEMLAPEMSLPAKDASLRLENGTIVPIPAEMGYTLNIGATLEALKADPAAILASETLLAVPQPVAPQVSDITPALAEAQRLLNAPFTIEAYDPIQDEKISWPVARQVVAGWLAVAPGEDGPQILFDENQVAAYLTQLAGSLGNGRSLNVAGDSRPLAEALRAGHPYTVMVTHLPTTYRVQPGDTLLKIGWKLGMPFWMIARANPGVNPEAIPSGTDLIIPAKTDLLPLPVIPNKRIVINISEQRLRVFQDGKRIGQHVISTGIDRSPTQPGVFQVQTHEPNAYASVWDLYMPNFLGIYEAWPGFMNGIHGLPTLSNGQRLWANVLGLPASYGCIILDLETARWLYQWAEDGVVVEIQP